MIINIDQIAEDNILGASADRQWSNQDGTPTGPCRQDVGLSEYIELAAQCWCDSKVSDRVMDVELATVFAKKLKQVAEMAFKAGVELLAQLGGHGVDVDARHAIESESVDFSRLSSLIPSASLVLIITNVIKHALPDVNPTPEQESAFESSKEFGGAHLFFESHDPVMISADWYRENNPEPGGFYIVRNHSYLQRYEQQYLKGDAVIIKSVEKK